MPWNLAVAIVGASQTVQRRPWILSRNERHWNSSGWRRSDLPVATCRMHHRALSLQGIPIEKLLLTRESQRQLQDLAGNAMTSTVVGAALMSALIVTHQAPEIG